MKIHGSNWRVVKQITPDPDKVESQARIARLKSEKAQFVRTIAELHQRRSARIAELERRIGEINSILGIKNETKLEAATEKGLDKILYLPAGRVRSLAGDPYLMDFVVDERMAALLNIFAVTCFNDGHPPFLDLMHDYKTRCFEITHFTFEPEAGVYACGSYTTQGKQLRDQDRISGVSISTMLASDNRSANLAFGQVKSSGADDTAHRERIRATPETLAVMGAVLIDGTTSVLQPYESPTEKWKRMLEQIDAAPLPACINTTDNSTIGV